MKLAPRTFRIEWDLHAWAGIIASNLLFVIFFCGIFALIHEELHTWQDPRLHVPEPAEGTPTPSFDSLLAQAKQHAQIPEGADVGLAFEGTTIGHAWFNHAETETEKEMMIDLASGQLMEEHTRLADELYLMHFFYRMPGGEQLAGVIAVVLFLAVISGLLMHLKDLKRQFWSFRPRLKLRFSASDAHKVLGVFGLPFTMMFAWTGALLGLWSLAFSGIAGAAFEGDNERVARARGEEAWEREPAKKSAEMRSFDAQLEQGRAAANAEGAAISWMGTQLYGDERALTRVYFKGKGFEREPYAVLDGRTGDIVRTQDQAPPSAGFERTMFALHYASYGGMLINVLYMLLAFAVCAVIVTGNLVWLERRDPKRQSAGNRFLERLTAGICAGCVLSVAVYFAANRALPTGMQARGDWEFGLYLGAWLLAALSVFIPRWTARQHAVAQSALAAVLFFGVVLGDLIFLDVNIATAVARDVPRVLVIELMVLVLGASCAALAWSLARRR